VGNQTKTHENDLEILGEIAPILQLVRDVRGLQEEGVCCWGLSSNLGVVTEEDQWDFSLGRRDANYLD
jgi:hypothetical protein